MSKKYTKEEITGKCSEAMKDIGNFYKRKFLNYGGKTAKGELYTEIIAGFIIEHIEEFRTNIPMITRKDSYNIETHNGDFDNNSRRIEEITAMKIYKQCNPNGRNGAKEKLDYIGSVIDYQTPLKSVKKDKAGKIDLLADDGKQLIILELKRPDSKETMLRCVMECYTYLKTVNHKDLISSFVKDEKLRENYSVSASPFVFKDGAQYREMQEDRPNLKQLMELLSIKPYYISEKYYVTED